MKRIKLFEEIDFNEDDWEFEEEDPDMNLKVGDWVYISNDTELWETRRDTNVFKKYIGNDTIESHKIKDIKYSTEITKDASYNTTIPKYIYEGYMMIISGKYPWFKIDNTVRKAEQRTNEELNWGKPKKEEPKIEEWELDEEPWEFEEFDKTDELETLFKYKGKILLVTQSDITNNYTPRLAVITDIKTFTKGNKMGLLQLVINKSLSFTVDKNGKWKENDLKFIKYFCNNLDKYRRDYIESIKDIEVLKKLGYK